MNEKDLPETETVVEVTGVSVSLSVKRTEVPDPHELPPGETYRDSPGEVPGGFVHSRFEPAIPATYGEPLELLEPAIPGEVVEPYSGERGEELQHGVLQPAPPGEPARPVEPGLPPLEPQTLTKRHVLVHEPAKTDPAEPGDPGLPPTEPLQPLLKAKKHVVVVVVPKAPGETAPEFRRALKPSIPGKPALPVDPGRPPIPGEQSPGESEQARVRVRGRLLEPTEQGRELRKLEPTVPARPLQPGQPNLPLQPAVLGVPAQPVQPAVPASAPPTPEGTVEAPLQQKQQLLPMHQPQQPPPAYQPPPVQNPPVQNAPVQNAPAQNPPGQNPPGQNPPGYSGYPGGYNFSGMPPGIGNSQVPPTGDVGPDPNIQFDEAQYTALIAVIGEIKAGARKAITHDDVYLDAELQLQPMNQTWEPAQKLVKWGTNFGGTVYTENKNLRKKLTQLENGLEKAKVVFKDTDDLAAYDVTKFTTEFPGFTGGTGAV